jgi:hypothetical protein
LREFVTEFLYSLSEEMNHWQVIIFFEISLTMFFRAPFGCEYRRQNPDNAKNGHQNHDQQIY